MSERIPEFLVKDIMNCIEKIISFTNGYDFQRFSEDERTIDAVIRNIEVMGEAANKLPESFLNNHPEVSWNTIIATRNRLIHGYDTIDNRILWDIVQYNLLPLKTQLEKLNE